MRAQEGLKHSGAGTCPEGPSGMMDWKEKRAWDLLGCRELDSGVGVLVVGTQSGFTYGLMKIHLVEVLGSSPRTKDKTLLVSARCLWHWWAPLPSCLLCAGLCWFAASCFMSCGWCSALRGLIKLADAMGIQNQ